MLTLMAYMQVINDKFVFLLEDAKTGTIPMPHVQNFLSSTATLLQQMLTSESPIIPWTGQPIYHPLFVDVDARQMPSKADVKAEDYFKGWKIAGYKRPILLSCNHRKVKIVKGKVWLEEPK